MQVISLKDYAKNNNISYEAVRKQVVRYAAELGEHLIRDGRQQFLDEEAVAFLDEKRKKNPVVLYEIAKDEEIDRLEEQNKNLLLELASVQKQLIKAQEDMRILNEQNSKIALLEADNEAAMQRAKKAEDRAEASDQALEDAKIKLQEAEKDMQILNDKHSELAFENEELKEKTETLRCVAEMTAQERDQERQRAEDLRAELEEIQNRGFFARVFNKKKKKGF